MTATAQRQGPKELLKSMAGGRLYKEAAEKGVNLSRFLEMEDPSEQYKDGTDAFTRLVREAGIVTRSDPRGGYYADRVESFGKSAESLSLLPEFTARRWREAIHGPTGQRAPYMSDSTPLNSQLRPYFNEPEVMASTPTLVDIPISELVATTQGVEGDAVRATYLTTSATASRLVRVSEAAEIPRAKLATSERTIRLYKYGRVLEASYEDIRRMPIDEFGLYIGELAAQAEVDKLATILDVIVNGDGNSGTAATNYNMSTLDADAVSGTLSIKAWLAFKMKFRGGYSLTTALQREALALQMMLLNVGSANVPLVSIQGASGFGSFAAINPQLRDGVRMGWTDEAPANVIVGFDKRRTVRRYFEIGGNIEEAQRWSTRQVETLTLSEVEGYAIRDANGSKTLTVNA